ncbi:aminodeoxychorismate lyase apoprotein [Shewanella denitrificans OS217]|jgi:4-amino-4-deoxychorismate lyase|uniref:Aminodeoxychorismate lyase n=1 Tax=Shewanella denitrificans (strain OS217 / ATCC BAA-1090 / DSM 15013) TaxID=318161 RepID=Q12MJ1_SHEDO|nr:aminodeoxychorismate lyase [Shewanella denitrificans]ABE55335.1 aminodeoxychorismate lyase apoprotein [Shewanella denitrificans OS217]
MLPLWTNQPTTNGTVHSTAQGTAQGTVHGTIQGIHPLDRAIAYGDGVFATMRSNGEILFLADHLARLQQSCARLGFHWQASNTLMSELTQLAATYPKHCIKLIVSRGVGGRGYQAPISVSATEIVSVSEIPSFYGQWQQTGIRLALSDIRLGQQPRLAGIKHLNRLEQVLIKSQVLPQGMDDWLVLDSQDNVIESSVANLFGVKDGIIYTPALHQAGVSGVTREIIIKALLTLALPQGHTVVVSEFKQDFLMSCEHVFLSNSLFGVVDVTGIDNQGFAPWPQSAQLRHSLGLSL